MLKKQFGGKKLLQEFLRTETCVRRMCPSLRPWPGPRPLAARQCNKRSKEAKANQKRKYYDNFAKDLMDPTDASERATRRVDLVLRAMEKAKRGLFLLPVQPEERRGIVAWWFFRKWPGPRQ